MADAGGSPAGWRRLGLDAPLCGGVYHSKRVSNTERLIIVTKCVVGVEVANVELAVSL